MSAVNPQLAHTSKPETRPLISARGGSASQDDGIKLSRMRYNSQLGLANAIWSCIVHDDAGGLEGKPSWILTRITTVGTSWTPSPLPATWSRPSCFSPARRHKPPIPPRAGQERQDQ